MNRFLPSILAGLAVLSSLGSLSFQGDTPAITLPEGVRQQLNTQDGPFFTRVGCDTGSTRTESATAGTYETIELQRFTCVGDSLESYTCTDGIWALTQVDCPSGMVEFAASN